MMPQEQTTQDRRSDIKDSAMASLVKMPLVGSLINKLTEYVTEKQSIDAANSKTQAALVEKQNIILQKVSKDTSTLMRSMMLQIGVLNDIKKGNKERDRQAFLDKQKQAALEEEASLESKKDAVNVASKQAGQPSQEKVTSFFGMIGTLLKSIASLAATLIALPSKIAKSFKALLSLKNAVSMLPQIARFFLMNPIGIGLLAGATLITLLARDKNPEETTKGILNAGTPDTAMAEAIMKTAEAPDAEKQVKKQSLLADRPKEKKSLLFWKDSKLQQEYLDEIGWDEKTGTTSEERKRSTKTDVRKIDNQMEASQAETKSTTSQNNTTNTAVPVTPSALDALPLATNQTTNQSEPVAARPLTTKPTTDQTEPVATRFLAANPTADQTEPVAAKLPAQMPETVVEPNVQKSPQTPMSGSFISKASTDVESMYNIPVSNKSGGVIVNTNNSTASSAPKQRSPIPSPIANRGSIDNFAFSAV